MNNDVLHSGAHVDPFILNNLREIKETVASGKEWKKKSKRSFGIYDLWNIRKQAKYATASRRR